MERTDKIVAFSLMAFATLGIVAVMLSQENALAKKPTAATNFGQCNSAAAHIKDPAAKLAAQNACRAEFGKPLINATEPAENETETD